LSDYLRTLSRGRPSMQSLIEWKTKNWSTTSLWAVIGNSMRPLS
jgi:hypothetical protein